MFRQAPRRGRHGGHQRSFHGNRNGSRSSSRRFVGTRINESKFIKKANGQSSSTPESFKPVTPFTDLPVTPQLKTNIAKYGFVNPTPIQDGAMKPILEGKDVIGIANTGTGKTGAFVIPLLHKISQNIQTESVLIVVPTRELATQIRDEMRALGQSMNIYATLCIGGTNIRNQIQEIKRDPHVIIGTPGRIKDLIERRILNLAKFQTIVLDEVDRMLDMGFIHDIKYLISLLPPKRQSLFFSATISGTIQTLIHSFTKEAVMISVKTQDTANNVEQDVVRMQGNQKIDVLENLLKDEEFKKVMIFGRTKFGVERLSKTLEKKGFKAVSIHGDKPQVKRNQAIRLFKDNIVNILVATDVASRGIDIADITHVINFDQPATYDDYVHRIGRTGRANKKGIALTFVD